MKQRPKSDNAPVQHSTTDETMNKSDLLPAPTDTLPDVLSDSSTDDEDYEEEKDISAMYVDWMNELE